MAQSMEDRCELVLWGWDDAPDAEVRLYVSRRRRFDSLSVAKQTAWYRVEEDALDVGAAVLVNGTCVYALGLTDIRSLS
jgi:hypothetical protein